MYCSSPPLHIPPKKEHVISLFFPPHFSSSPDFSSVLESTVDRAFVHLSRTLVETYHSAAQRWVQQNMLSSLDHLYNLPTVPLPFRWQESFPSSQTMLNLCSVHNHLEALLRSALTYTTKPRAAALHPGCHSLLADVTDS